MHGQIVSCVKCHTALPESFFNHGELAPCPGCNSLLQAEIFPALYKPIAEGKPGETILIEGEASCFYHPQKRAAIPCGACGRFLCALCDVELNDEHLCPACLEAGRRKGRLTQLETKRTLWDSSALVLAVAPIILLCMWWVSLVTAPAAIFLAVYSWSQPASILPRTRVRSYLAIFLGLLQIAGWILLFTGAFRHLNLE
jgi:hypothetical protein